MLPLGELPKTLRATAIERGDSDHASDIFSVDWSTEQKLSTHVGDDLFIVGFPDNIRVTGDLPIWKRGSVASEPDIPPKDLPYLLVDTGTRRGMSGGTVVRRASTGIVPLGKPEKFVALSEPHEEFYGIYSGRFGAGDPLQLGIVWKRSVIADMLQRPTFGKSSLCTRLWL